MAGQMIFPLLLATITLMTKFVAMQPGGEEETDENIPDTPECRYCVSNSRCVYGVCHCKEGYVGNPYFACYHADHQYCSIVNDPVLSTFHKETEKLSIIGSAKIMDVDTQKGKTKCKIVAYMWTERFKNKIYIEGLLIKLKTESKTQESNFYDIRVQACVINGVYTYNVETSETDTGEFIPYPEINSTVPGNESAILLSIANCQVTICLARANFLRISLECCGVIFGIRAQNFGAHRVRPGIWIQVIPECSVYNNWPPYCEPLCLNSTYPMADIRTRTGLQTIRYAITYLALTNSDLTTYPGAPQELASLRDTLAYCPTNRRDAFFTNAGFMLELKPFVRCISPDDGLDNLVSIIILAAQGICNHDFRACYRSQDLIRSRCAYVISQETYRHEYDKKNVEALRQYLNSSCQWNE